MVAKIKTWTRALNGEAIISELPDLMSREQVVLVANADGYPPNAVLAKFTSGGNAGKWGRYTPGATDGSQNAKGYLVDSREGSAGTQRAAAIVRTADLNGKKLDWGDGVDEAEIATAIASMLALDTTNNYGGIRVRY